jgi:hypothetical protein
MSLRAALAVLALLLLPSAAGAAVFQDRGGLASFTNGIALAADGNFWITEAGNGTVVRMRPDGTVLGRFPVGSSPTSVSAGPGGRIWVAGTGSDALYWFDATSAAPTIHAIPTPTTCGPVAIAAGGNGKMYFTTPDDGCGQSRIGSVPDDGSGPATSSAVLGMGKVFDLAVSGGKVFAPDFEGDAIRRFNASLIVEAIITAPAGSSPDGIAVDGAGSVWTTLYTAGKVARFPANAPNGTLATALPASGILAPFGIALGADGRMYVAAQLSSELARIDPASNTVTRFAASGAQPFQLVAGPDADLYVTDTANARVLRFVSNPPRAATGEAREAAPTAGSAGAKVDARGNATTVVFDYGTTTAYGATTAPVTVPEGVGEVDVRADLTALTPNTTYHVRVRAANAEGETLGADTTVTTPLPPPAELPASAKYKWRFSSTWTQLTKVVVRRLRVGDTVKLTCKGKGCAVKKKTRQATGAKMKLTRYFGRKHKLRKGVRVRITVTAPNAIGIVSRLDVRKGKDPKISRRCLPPGATKPQRCSG